MYNLTNDKKFLTTSTNLDKYDTDKYYPIGIVAIPSSHDVYETGECSAISLVNMDYESPDTGSLYTRDGYQSRYIPVGVYNEALGDIYNIIPTCGTIESPSTETVLTDYSDASSIEVYFPSDEYTNGITCPQNTNIKYYNDETFWESHNTGTVGPPPFLEDGSRNPAFYEGDGNILSRYDGKEVSAIMIELSTYQEDWKTADTITYTTGADNCYPAAECCWRFHTVGTSQGDWYLPTLAELVYFTCNGAMINSIINKLIEKWGEDKFIEFSMWSFYESCYYARDNQIFWEIGTGWGNISPGANVGPIRAFLRIDPNNLN